jgi:hypothetical protein
MPSLKLLKASLGEEESVATRITADFSLVVLLGFKFLPDAGRVYVLIALIPPSINHLGERRIIRSALQRRYIGPTPQNTARRNRDRVCCCVLEWSLCAVAKQRLVVGPNALVHDEKIEFVMLADVNWAIRSG